MDATSVAAPDRHNERVIDRPCPICGATGGPDVLEHDGWVLRACDGCGLAYLPRIPTDEAVDTDFEWQESFNRERAERWMRHPLMRAWTLLTIVLKPPRELRAMRRIRRVAPPPGRLIDVGCGAGRLCAWARRMGYEPLGVEVSPHMAAKAARRLGPDRVLRGRLADFDLEPASFDLAATVSYLEHEPEPARICRRMFELVRPGGWCVHKVPNYDSGLRKLLGSRWSGYRWPEHFQYFTPASLSRLMTDAGFEVVEVQAPAWSDNLWLFARRPS